MLKIFFDKTNSVAAGKLKVSPGVFLQHPKDITADLDKQARLVNDTMSLLAPYLSQFYYNDDELNKIPALSGISAILLRPDDSGNLYLKGNRNNERVITDKLISELEPALASKIKPITVITHKGNVLESKTAEIKANFSSIVDINPAETAKTSTRLTRLYAQTPDLALFEMLDKNQVNVNAALLALYLNGNDLDDFNTDKISDNLQQTLRFYESITSKERAGAINAKLQGLLSKIDNGYQKSLNFKDLCKESVTQLLARNWRDLTSTFDLYWSEHPIGLITKLASSMDIRLLAGREQSWAVSTAQKVSGYVVPKIYTCVTPYFPPAVQALLPERVSSELQRVHPSAYHTEVLKSKPYALGCLYFHDRRNPDEPSNPLSVIDVKLDDVSDGLTFKPDSSQINLDQNIDNFERFANEIANKGCLHSIPGFQLKAPANITIENNKQILRFAEPATFTHIVKFPSAKKEKTGTVYCELFGMAAAASMGVNTASFKAVQTNVEVLRGILPTNKGIIDDIVSTGEPAYITELFDRPVQGEKALFMNEDFHSSSKKIDKYSTKDPALSEGMTSSTPSLYTAIGKPIDCDTSHRFHGVDILAKVLKQRSTNYDEDAKMLFRQLISNTLVGNGDAHLKNFSLLHKSTMNGGTSVRLSPAYDIVSTRALSAGSYFTDGVCMLGGVYSPSRNDVINDGVVHFGLSKDVATQILDDTINKSHEFAYSTASSPAVYSIFNNTLMGKEILKRCVAYMKLQISALSENTLDPNRGVDDKRLFASVYPGESYDKYDPLANMSTSEINLFDLPVDDARYLGPVDVGPQDVGTLSTRDAALKL